MDRRKLFYSSLLFLILGIGFYYGSQHIPEDTIKKLDNAGIFFGYLLACLSSSVALYFYLNRHLMMRPRYSVLGETLPAIGKYVKAVVIPVSRTQPPEWIIRWLEPEAVALIYTGKKGSIAATRALVANYHGTRCKIKPLAQQIDEHDGMLSDPDNPIASKTLARSYINSFIEMGYNQSEIFVDVTGGKTAMSLGLFQAAEEMGVATIYITGKHKGKVKKPLERDDAQAIYMSNPRRM